MSLLIGAVGLAILGHDLVLTSERTSFRETGEYAEIVEFYRTLDRMSDRVTVHEIGTSPQGREIIAVVLSAHGVRKAEDRDPSRPCSLIINCIHPGEVAGKDATAILAREIVVEEKHPEILESMDLVIVPVFSVDGHERSSPYNRINQNGPAEMGWRATARNLNLNRDWMKLDAPEMRAMVSLIREWDFDFGIDNHTTNGGDWQYTMMYEAPNHPAMDAEVAAFNRAFSAAAAQFTEDSGFLTAPYFGSFNYANPEQGIRLGFYGPRYSTGYMALRHIPSLLVEAHMLKPYQDRVESTYAINLGSLKYVAANGSTLLTARRNAKERDMRVTAGQQVVLTARNSGRYRPWTYKGFEYTPYESEISGSRIHAWGDEPMDFESRIADQFEPDVRAEVPYGWYIPREWTEIIERIELHGIEHEVVDRDHELPFDISADFLTFVEYPQRSNEGRFTPRFEIERVMRTVNPRKGDVIVPVAQPFGRLAASLLMPESPDSCVRWGLINVIFEPKEYFEHYVMEPIARRMLEQSAELRAEFEALMNVPEFANSPQNRLEFFYRRSPFFDQKFGIHPVYPINRQTYRLLESNS